MRKTLALILLLFAASLPLMANISFAPDGVAWLSDGGVIWLRSNVIATGTSSSSDVTATMTSFSTPSPYVVTAYAGSYQAGWKAFDHSTTSTNYWGADRAGTWIVFDFSASFSYAIQKVRFLGETGNNNPKSFNIIAWNDGDPASTTLYIGTGTNALTWQEFSWTNTTQYRYVKFDNKSTIGGSALRIYEIEYLE